ncbi:MAG: RelA/SpoT family protein [Bacteroidetes bacterium GWE2_29_8]|nr:MAG: RelA/SpoT family protein [Bacteroidetes bacterium GWE2_29_8]OFY20073.1 MAG: RelA/SpoT family protein [Bacteroidetes bacterium GWF2_29_10]
MRKFNVSSEKKEILRKYGVLLRTCRPNTNQEQKQLIRKAFNVALEAHRDMRRQSGEPYIYHPIAVAMIVTTEIGLGTTSIVCSLLHDVVEDTDYTLLDIENMFGPKISKIIDGLTKISDIQATSLQAENFKKMLFTLSDDVRVILIKLADRLHNMRTLDSLPLEKQMRIASETKYFYAPLAHRLGLFSIKSELEDLVLKYTEPDVYRQITEKIADSEEERAIFIEKFMEPLKFGLDKKGFSYQIMSRIKSINSIWNKMKKKDIPFEEVYDLFAIRIIVDSPYENEKSDCWKVYSLTTDIYKSNPDRLRDWISNPKANGYESLHTTVMSNQGKWVEVQIRSTRMNEIAEKGYAAHWKYKETYPTDLGVDSWLTKIREMLQNPECDALDFLDDIKLNLFSEEIFVFTPSGEIKTLPIHSSIIDFAYAIHTKLGDTCIGGKVNHKTVPFNYKLKSGDQVEVLTSTKQRPKEEWLDFALTARAKSKIKDALKEEKKIITEKGKELLTAKFGALKIEMNSESINRLQNFYNIPNNNELFYRIGNGTITDNHIKTYLKSKEKNKWLNYLTKAFVRDKKDKFEVKSDDEALKFSSKLLDKIKSNHESLVIGEKDAIKYSIATCCNPIPGDDIFGFIDLDEGIKIHRINCPEGIQLLSKYGKRIIKTKWTKNAAVAMLTGIHINGIDDMGIISNITKIISNELNINMRSISFESSDGVYQGTVTLYVHDTKHLNDLILKLKKVHGVLNVTRIERG